MLPKDVAPPCCPPKVGAFSDWFARLPNEAPPLPPNTAEFEPNVEPPPILAVEPNVGAFAPNVGLGGLPPNVGPLPNTGAAPKPPPDGDPNVGALPKAGAPPKAACVEPKAPLPLFPPPNVLLEF